MGKSKKLAEATALKKRTEFAKKEFLFIADGTGKAIGTILKPGTDAAAALEGMMMLRNDVLQAGANINLMTLIDGVIAAMRSPVPLYVID